MRDRTGDLGEIKGSNMPTYKIWRFIESTEGDLGGIIEAKPLTSDCVISSDALITVEEDEDEVAVREYTCCLSKNEIQVQLVPLELPTVGIISRLRHIASEENGSWEIMNIGIMVKTGDDFSVTVDIQEFLKFFEAVEFQDLRPQFDRYRRSKSKCKGRNR